MSIKTYILNKGIRPVAIKDYNYKENEINKNDIFAFEALSFNLTLTELKKKLLLKIQNKGVYLSNFYEVRYGIKTGNNKAYVNKHQPHFDWKKCIPSANIVKKYCLKWEGDYIHYGKHLSGYSENSFEKPKILIHYIRKLSMDIRLVSTLDKNGEYYPLNNFSFIQEKNSEFSLYYILTLMNSKLFNFYFKNIFIDYNIKPKYIEKLPVKEISSFTQKPFIKKANEMLALNDQLQDINGKFLRSLERKFNLTELSKNLQSWQNLTYSELIKELGKKKIKLSLADEAEWEDYFLAEQQKAQTTQAQITQTDKEIDNMVYQLYGLTDDEIKIIESH